LQACIDLIEKVRYGNSSQLNKWPNTYMMHNIY
jgi:hypothetical protein